MPRLTREHVKIARSLGFRLTYDHDYEEFRLHPTERKGDGADYFTSDADDAILTARAIRRAEPNYCERGTHILEWF